MNGQLPILLRAEAKPSVPPRLALEAQEAGRYLAERLGLRRPISQFAMWKYARLGEIPHKRLGRHVWFLTDELDEFVAAGTAIQHSR